MPIRLVKYHYLRFLRLPGDPKSIALGVAIGIFIGVLPVFPVQTILIFGFCLHFKASKVAGILSSLIISNPFTFFFQYYLSWLVGNMILPDLLSWHRLQEVMAVRSSASGFDAFKSSLCAISALGFDAIMVMLVGGTLLALPFTALGYYYSLKFFTKLRDKKSKKLEQPGRTHESK